MIKVLKSIYICHNFFRKKCLVDSNDTTYLPTKTLVIYNPCIKIDKNKISLDQVIEEEDGFQKDPISDKASRDHFVKCRITRNRKGIRGQVYLIYKYI